LPSFLAPSSLIRKGAEKFTALLGLTEQARQERYKYHADEGNTAACHELFHPQLGVKTLLDGGRRRTKNLYGVVKRTVPAGQVRQ